ncbi:hypothetical protein [Flavobacterium fluviatile]|uniref:hypothetical protein n=1 Tax=Flavobacterium fluviatile TaxID=1862387 RepID=UPI0013D3DE5B|nr:hypothetical protein [Flavobacterium fluviatile]
MITINNGSVHELLLAANTGPFMQAEIVSLTGKGKLRVTCNWLYSSLNCDSNDNSTFLWQFNKIDDQHISLSPVNSCINKTIYASVRDDINYYLQVQAPYSADWITAVGRDEIIGFKLQGTFIGAFTGFNNKFIALNDNSDSHGGHTGFRLRSAGDTFNQNAQWFVAIKNSLQQHIHFSGVKYDLTTIEKEINTLNMTLDNDVLEKVILQINS